MGLILVCSMDMDYLLMVLILSLETPYTLNKSISINCVSTKLSISIAKPTFVLPATFLVPNVSSNLLIALYVPQVTISLLVNILVDYVMMLSEDVVNVLMLLFVRVVMQVNVTISLCLIIMELNVNVEVDIFRRIELVMLVGKDVLLAKMPVHAYNAKHLGN